jgi:hypothetical protein
MASGAGRSWTRMTTAAPRTPMSGGRGATSLTFNGSSPRGGFIEQAPGDHRGMPRVEQLHLPDPGATETVLATHEAALPGFPVVPPVQAQPQEDPIFSPQIPRAGSGPLPNGSSSSALWRPACVLKRVQNAMRSILVTIGCDI